MVQGADWRCTCYPVSSSYLPAQDPSTWDKGYAVPFGDQTSTSKQIAYLLRNRNDGHRFAHLSEILREEFTYIVAMSEEADMYRQSTGR